MYRDSGGTLCGLGYRRDAGNERGWKKRLDLGLGHPMRSSGEREDSRNPLWKRTAVRPYDTPITKRGEAEARRKWQGKKRTELSVRHIAIIVLLQMWPETRNDFPCPVFLVHGNEAASHDAS